MLKLNFQFYNLAQDPGFVDCIKYLVTNHDTFAGDNLVTFNRSLTFLKDEQFVKVLTEHPDDAVRDVAWRLHVYCWAAKSCLKIDGDFMQFGVGGSVFISVVLEYLMFNTISKTWFMYDSFEGLPEQYHNDVKDYQKFPNFGEEGIYEQTCQRFASYENVQFIKGALPQKLEDVCPEKIAFCHLDLTNYPSEAAVLEKIFDKIVPGGVVLLETLGWKSYDCGKLVDLDILKKQELLVLELPTGQGLIIKR